MRRLLFAILLLIPAVVFAQTTTNMRPSADTACGFTPSSGTDCFAMVDEASSDSDTTYNTNSSTGIVDTFTAASAGIGATDTIDSVILKCTAKDTGGGNNKLILRVIHDATYDSTSEVLLTTYAEYTHDVTLSESWQPADFDGQAVQFGYVSDGNGSVERRVTQCFLEVIHTVASTGAQLPVNLLMR